ncbi:MAG TPA: cupin domain-containing protein [Tepidisphaeraceae bacterium]|jgi:cupin 2 domain-containing protein
MAKIDNIFDNLPPANAAEEAFRALLQTPGVRIERIVSQGHASPEEFWYDQETHEWVLLLAGAARLQFEGEAPIDLKPGSYLHIPAHRRHRVDWTDPTQPTVWLAIHYS